MALGRSVSLVVSALFNIYLRPFLQSVSL
uniref:Uncharacterized protein n=1 Tax=Arundo donax TaxID=35708 RepID=A0A0A9FNM2_ARUDO